MSRRLIFTDRTQGEQFSILAFLVFIGFATYFAWLKDAHGGIFDTQWTKIRPAAAKPYEYYVVTDPNAVCRRLGAKELNHINACARIEGTRCRIYMPPRLPNDLIEHEEKHCEGYDHP